MRNWAERSVCPIVPGKTSLLHSSPAPSHRLWCSRMVPLGQCIAFTRAVFAGDASDTARAPLHAMGIRRYKLLNHSIGRLLSPAARPRQCPLNWLTLLMAPLWAKYWFMSCGIWGLLEATGLACSWSTQSHLNSPDLLLTWSCCYLDKGSLTFLYWSYMFSH